MYKLTLFFTNGFEEVYPSVDMYLESKDNVARFINRGMSTGGVWIYDITTGISQLTHGRNILRAEVKKIDPSEVVNTPYIVEAVK